MKNLIFLTTLLLVTSSLGGNYSNATTNPVKVIQEKHSTESVLPKEDQDAFLTTQVRVALREVPGFMEDKITIKADKGTITLTGTVAEEATKTAFGEKAKGVKGVDSVKNDIKVSK